MRPTIFIIVLCCFLTACGNQKEKDKVKDNVAVADSAHQRPDVDYSQFVNKPEILDTVHGDWHLRAELYYDGHTYTYQFEDETYRYAVYSLKINISKDGKTIFKDVVITPKSFLGEFYEKDMGFYYLPGVVFSATSCYVFAAACQPESDNCLFKMLAFSPNQPMRKYELTDCLGDELDGAISFISEFFAMYMHELSLPKPSSQAINKLLHEYCSPDMAKRLAHATQTDNPLWGKGTFNSRWLEGLYFDTDAEKKDWALMKFRKLPDTTEVVRHVHLQSFEHKPWVRLLDVRE